MQFSKPPIVNPNITIPPKQEDSKIAKPVPFEKLPEERKEDYQALVEEFKKDAPTPPAKETTQVEEEVPEVEDEVSDEDKQQFMRCILGGKKFSKAYTLFNSVTVTVTDRSVEDTENLYELLSNDIKTEKIKISTEEQWFVWLDRYIMAVNIVKVEGVDNFTLSGTLNEKLKKIMDLPRPLYQALLETSKKFESLILTMVEKAQDQRFWQAGGAN